jgi:hypothetical protein
MLNLFEGENENVFLLRCSAEDEHNFEPTFPLKLPNTEDRFQQMMAGLAQFSRRARRNVGGDATPAPGKRRGRPIDPRITAQQRKRVRLFLAEWLWAGKSKREAEEAVSERYGVDRRTLARDRKAHEFAERYPPAMVFAVNTALVIYGCLKGWRAPPRYSLCPKALTQYRGATGDDVKSPELVS